MDAYVCDVKTMQKWTADEDDGRRRRRRRQGNHQHHQHQQPHHHQARGAGAGRCPVLVLREPRLELCHPDDFHALRASCDPLEDPSPALDAAAAAVSLAACARHRVDDRPPPTPPTHDGLPGGIGRGPWCHVDCCCAGLHGDTPPDDAIPLPVHYVAAQDDDDDDDDDCDYSDDESSCSDGSRRLISKSASVYDK